MPPSRLWELDTGTQRYALEHPGTYPGTHRHTCSLTGHTYIHSLGEAAPSGWRLSLWVLPPPPASCGWGTAAGEAGVGSDREHQPQPCTSDLQPTHGGGVSPQSPHPPARGARGQAHRSGFVGMQRTRGGRAGLGRVFRMCEDKHGATLCDPASHSSSPQCETHGLGAELVSYGRGVLGCPCLSGSGQTHVSPGWPCEPPGRVRVQGHSRVPWLPLGSGGAVYS